MVSGKYNQIAFGFAVLASYLNDDVKFITRRTLNCRKSD